MYAIAIRARSTKAPAELSDVSTAFAEALMDVPGLVFKTWLTRGSNEIGGFYVFESEEAASAYVDGELFRGLQANPAMSAWKVEHWGVVPELSVRTGTPRAPLIVTRAA